jgi:TRAP transporter TAXI family solute receptor
MRSVGPDAHIADDQAVERASRRRRRQWWLVGTIGAFVVAVVAAVPFFGPSPPRRIVMAGGQPEGVYSAVARNFQARLARVGLEVKVVQTSGSIDNLERLLRREVDVALVQGGTSTLVPGATEQLRGLAALYFEPLWVFHRVEGLTSLGALRGTRVSVGPAASGTEAVATALLREYGIDGATQVVNLPNTEAGERLVRGELDAVFMVTSYRDVTVLDLLNRRDVQLLSFRRDAAHARKLAPLQPLKLHEGVIDLRRNVPGEDKTLLAAAALLVSRADLHPRVVEQLLKVAHALHRPGSLLDPPLRFPSLDGLDLEPHEAAEIYLTDGESFLSRTLPYPMLRWALILRVLVLGLIVWIPLVRLLPEVSNWKANRQFARLYAMLWQEERAVAGASQADELRERIAGLDRLATSTATLWQKVPSSRQRDVYHCRVHIALVRNDACARLARMEEPDSGEGRMVPGPSVGRSG